MNRCEKGKLPTKLFENKYQKELCLLIKPHDTVSHFKYQYLLYNSYLSFFQYLKNNI